MTFVMPLDCAASVAATVSTHLPGNSIRNVSKVCAVLKLLQQGCELEMFALNLDAKLCRVCIEPLALPFKKGFFSFIDDLDAIATKFKSNFVLPDAAGFNSEDEKTFRILRAFALSEPLNLTNLTTGLVKSPENAELVPQQFRDEMSFRMEHESATAVLFGTQLNIGSCVVQIDRAKVDRLSQTLQRFAKAKMGAAVPISLRPLSPVSFLLVNPASLLANSKSAH